MYFEHTPHNKIQLLNTPFKNGKLPLHAAAEAAAHINNIEILKIFITYGADITSKSLNMRLLHWVLLFKKTTHEFLQQLQTNNWIVTTKDNSTAAIIAIANNNVDALTFLQEYGYWDPKQSVNYYKYYSQLLSIVHNKNKKTNLAHVKSAYLNSHQEKDSYRFHPFQTPLLTAVGNGHLNLVKLLIETYKLPINETDLNGMSALHIAARFGQLDIIEYLISKKAKVNNHNIYKKSPLYIAIENGYTDCAKLLITVEADVNAQTLSGLTPLSIALAQSSLELAKLILIAIKKRNIPIKFIKHAKAVAHSGNIEILELLLVYIDNENEKSDFLKKLIWKSAIMPESFALFAHALSKATIDFNEINKARDNLLQLTVIAGTTAQLELLTQQAHSQQYTQKHPKTGNTALHIACKLLDENAIRLLSPKANINQLNSDGYTALDVLLISMHSSDNPKYERLPSILYLTRNLTEICLHPESHNALLKLRKNQLLDNYFSRITIKQHVFSSNNDTQYIPTLELNTASHSYYLPNQKLTESLKTVTSRQSLSNRIADYKAKLVNNLKFSWYQNAFSTEQAEILAVEGIAEPNCFLYLDIQALLAQAKNYQDETITEEKLKKISAVFYHTIKNSCSVELIINNESSTGSITHELKINKKLRILVVRAPQKSNDNKKNTQGTLFIGLLL